MKVKRITFNPIINEMIKRKNIQFRKLIVCFVCGLFLGVLISIIIGIIK
jgi:hypothetical protein